MAQVSLKNSKSSGAPLLLNSQGSLAPLLLKSIGASPKSIGASQKSIGASVEFSRLTLYQGKAH